MTQFNNRIVTDGLVLAMDFTNPRSYAGLGVNNLAAVANGGSGFENCTTIYCTKYDLGNGKFRFVSNHASFPATVRVYTNLVNLQNAINYWSSAWYEQYTGTTAITIDFCDVGTGDGVLSSTAKSGKLSILTNRATYDATYRFFDITFENGSSIVLYDPILERANYVDGTSYSGPSNTYFVTRALNEELKPLVGSQVFTRTTMAHKKTTLPNGDIYYPPYVTPGSFYRYYTTTNMPVTSSFTYAVWIKRESSQNAHNMICGQYLPYISFNVTNQFKLSTVISGTQRTLTTTNTFSNGVWYHVVGMFDHVAGAMRIYVDGVLDSTASYTGTNNGASLPFTIFDWRYDQIFTPGQELAPFTGAISTVNVYNRALTAEEVKINFDAHKSYYGK